MLKFVFNFRTRGVRLFVWRVFPDQIVTWLFACYIYASEEMEMWWTMVIVQICKNLSVLVIFLAFGFGTHTCRLALDLGICSIGFGICSIGFKRRDSGTGRLFCTKFFFVHSVCFIQFALFVIKKVVLYCIVFGIQKSCTV